MHVTVSLSRWVCSIVRHRPPWLPPATSKAPFVVMDVVKRFDFRCLHENRRVVNDPAKRAKTEEFHQILADISYGRCTEIVRQFVIDSYVR